jgi:YHS domain-containing protein
MKRIVFYSIIWMAGGLTACNHNTEKPAASTEQSTPAAKHIDIKLGQLASKKDVVCGMPIEEGSIADTATLDGKLYAFCSSECKGEFIKKPQSYLDQK